MEQYLKQVTHIQECISENMAAKGGGAFYIHDDDITIEKCFFKNDIASYSGGAIEIFYSRSLLVKNRTFERTMVKILTQKKLLAERYVQAIAQI